MNTAKDANGVEIKVGDVVRHRLVPGEMPANGDPRGLGDSMHEFGGSAKITEIFSGAFVRTLPNSRSGIPVYCAANVVKV